MEIYIYIYTRCLYLLQIFFPHLSCPLSLSCLLVINVLNFMQNVANLFISWLRLSMSYYIFLFESLSYNIIPILYNHIYI